MNKSNYIFAIDIGGTNIKYGVILNHKIIMEGYFPTSEKANLFFNTIKKIFLDLKRKYSFNHIAISAPGTFDYQKYKIGSYSAIPYIHQNNFINKLKKIFNLPIIVENDANCAAIAEHELGFAQKRNNFVLLTLGTGIGGAIFINGKLYKGSSKKAGEFGLMYSSFEKSLGWLTSLKKIVKNQKKIMEDFKIEDFIKQNKMNKGELNLIYKKLIKCYALIIWNVQVCFDPEIILIAGGLSYYESLIKDIKIEINEIRKREVKMQISLKLKRSFFKNKANLIGASFLSVELN